MMTELSGSWCEDEIVMMSLKMMPKQKLALHWKKKLWLGPFVEVCAGQQSGGTQQGGRKAVGGMIHTSLGMAALY